MASYQYCLVSPTYYDDSNAVYSDGASGVCEENINKLETKEVLGLKVYQKMLYYKPKLAQNMFCLYFFNFGYL